MIIEPKIRGFICTTAHPKGCQQSVAEQIKYIEQQKPFTGPKNVLVIGASTGYGLASRIAAAFGSNAKTIGVFYEKPADEKRTASAGWYNAAAFQHFAKLKGLYAKSINGDAFSNDIKQQVAELIKRDLGKVDLIIYSLASPRRLHPETGEVHSSVLKPIGKDFIGTTVDAFKEEIKQVRIEPASEEEIQHTEAVMGGEDWEMWIDFLLKQDLLAEGAKTVAYSYIGPRLTHAIYKDGTIGRAKDHLRATADKLQKKLTPAVQGQAVVAVAKAVVTQASAAIPVVPLYIAILFKLMKQAGTHEGCIEQMYRLLSTKLYPQIHRDQDGYVRVDDLEMRPEIQQQIEAIWPTITNENLTQLADIEGYRNEFYRLFGFNIAGVDYQQDIDTHIALTE